MVADARHYRYHKRVGQAICQLVGKHGVNSLLSPQHMLHFTGMTECWVATSAWHWLFWTKHLYFV